MKLSQATSESLIFLEQDFTTKKEIFEFVAQKLAEENKIESAEVFKSALYSREDMGITGFENGLAIPHGKSSTVREATFAVVRLSRPLTPSAYPSLNPENQVDTLFVLAIPENQAGTLHLTLLADLAGRLGDTDYLNKIKAARTPEEMLMILETDEKETVEETDDKGLILGITACAAGIAHTYIVRK